MPSGRRNRPSARGGRFGGGGRFNWRYRNLRYRYFKRYRSMGTPPTGECKACKKYQQIERWKVLKELYDSGGSRVDPGNKPQVKKGHKPGCQHYKQKGSGPQRKDSKQPVCCNLPVIYLCCVVVLSVKRYRSMCACCFLPASTHHGYPRQ